MLRKRPADHGANRRRDRPGTAFHRYQPSGAGSARCHVRHAEDIVQSALAERYQVGDNDACDRQDRAAACALNSYR